MSSNDGFVYLGDGEWRFDGQDTWDRRELIDYHGMMDRYQEIAGNMDMSDQDNQIWGLWLHHLEVLGDGTSDTLDPTFVAMAIAASPVFRYLLTGKGPSPGRLPDERIQAMRNDQDPETFIGLTVEQPTGTIQVRIGKYVAGMFELKVVDDPYIPGIPSVTIEQN